MQKFILLFVVIVAVWFINKDTKTEVVEPISTTSYTTPKSIAYESSVYECDGRQHCSQMTSCAEATYFLNNCPNTKMDGNHDGVPCETQWCN